MPTAGRGAAAPSLPDLALKVNAKVGVSGAERDRRAADLARLHRVTGAAADEGAEQP